MIIGENVKIKGDHWDEALGLYLDVEAQVQGEPFWWSLYPDRYDQLQKARQEAGVQITDHLPTPPHLAQGTLNNEQIAKMYKEEKAS